MSAVWRQPRLLIAAILLLALVLRLGAIAVTDNYDPVYDAHDFDRIARHIADHGHYPDTYYAAPGTPTALNPPGYPHVLAVVYVVTGDSITAGRVVGALLGTVTVLLLMLIAWSLRGQLAGAVTGVLAAVYPPLLATNTALLSEQVFLPLTAGVILLLVAGRRVEGRGAVWLVAGAGVLCGMAALTRLVGAMLLVAVLIWIWQRSGESGRRRLALSGLALLAAALTISPWTLRNYRAFDSFVPIATESGTGAVGTYNAEAAKPGPTQGTWRPNWQLGKYKPLLNNELNEAELDRIWRDDAIEYAVDHPTYPFVALTRNTGRLFGLGPGHRYLEEISYDEMGIPRWAQKWVRVSVYLMTLLAIVGVVALRPFRDRAAPLRRHAILWVTPVLLLVMPAVALGSPRYRLPVDLFLVLAAGTGLAALAERRRRQSAATSRPAT